MLRFILSNILLAVILVAFTLLAVKLGWLPGLPSFWVESIVLLVLGFFTCGFHIAFLVTHLPGEVALCGLPSSVSERYDLIGIDPRGVGRSAPVSWTVSIAPA